MSYFISVTIPYYIRSFGCIFYPMFRLFHVQIVYLDIVHLSQVIYDLFKRIFLMNVTSIIVVACIDAIMIQSDLDITSRPIKVHV